MSRTASAKARGIALFVIVVAPGCWMVGPITPKGAKVSAGAGGEGAER